MQNDSHVSLLHDPLSIRRSEYTGPHLQLQFSRNFPPSSTYLHGALQIMLFFVRKRSWYNYSSTVSQCLQRVSIFKVLPDNVRKDRRTVSSCQCVSFRESIRPLITFEPDGWSSWNFVWTLYHQSQVHLCTLEFHAINNRPYVSGGRANFWVRSNMSVTDVW
jgi:hypothetical protein